MESASQICCLPEAKTMKKLLPLLFLIPFFLISCVAKTDLRIKETDAIPAMEAVSVEPRTVTMVSDGTHTVCRFCFPKRRSGRLS